MLKNVSLPELADVLSKQKSWKHDIIAPSTIIKSYHGSIMLKEEPSSSLSDLLQMNGIGTIPDVYEPLDIAHAQIAQKLGIPKAYYDRLLRHENVELFDENVNHWLKTEPNNYLLRNFVDGDNRTLRAFLSDRYKIIDNADVLYTALEAIQKSDIPVEITQCDMTDKRMYVKVDCPDITLKADELLRSYKPAMEKQNFGIMTGLIITNSETGHGRFRVAPRLKVLACSNGMIIEKDSFNNVHLGAKHDEGIVEWSDKTRKAEYELIMNQVNDAVKTFLSPEYLNGVIRYYSQRNKELEHPISAAKNVAKAFITKEKEDDLISYFAGSGDLTAMGLVNAVTAFAQTEEPDTRFALESSCTKIIDNINYYDVKVA
jgi:hypothetical protein